MADLFHQMTHYQNQRFRRHTKQRIVPAFLIGGFLGSGKTTLVNHVLADPEQARTDVLVREYGSVSIDDKLIGIEEERVHPFPGASLHADEQTMLYMAMDRLHDERFEKFDRLLLETSGLDSLEYLVQLFMLWDMPMMYALQSVYVLVDAEYGLLNLQEYREAREHVAFADVLVINKTDLADESAIRELERTLRGINAMAEICRTTYSRINLEEKAALSPYQQLRHLRPPEGERGDMWDIKSIVLTADEPLDKALVNQWINGVFQTNGSKILRGKGFFSFAGEDYRYEFQAVRKSFHSFARDRWGEDEQRKTTVVLIGENLPEQEALEASLLRCVRKEP